MNRKGAKTQSKDWLANSKSLWWDRVGEKADGNAYGLARKTGDYICPQGLCVFAVKSFMPDVRGGLELFVDCGD